MFTYDFLYSMKLNAIITRRTENIKMISIDIKRILFNYLLIFKLNIVLFIF